MPEVSSRDIPGSEQFPGAAAKVFSDVDHLIAHLESGANVFVTLDKSTILKRRAGLAAEGIVACLPTEAINTLR